MTTTTTTWAALLLLSFCGVLLGTYVSTSLCSRAPASCLTPSSPNSSCLDWLVDAPLLPELPSLRGVPTLSLPASAHLASFLRITVLPCFDLFVDLSSRILQPYQGGRNGNCQLGALILAPLGPTTGLNLEGFVKHPQSQPCEVANAVLSIPGNQGVHAETFSRDVLGTLYRLCFLASVGTEER